ncbi:hypothetical protein MMC25_004026 [Agyrium rufum]|nr:hypothetical protein [Agyrium rufum]
MKAKCFPAASRIRVFDSALNSKGDYYPGPRNDPRIDYRNPNVNVTTKLARFSPGGPNSSGGIPISDAGTTGLHPPLSWDRGQLGPEPEFWVSTRRNARIPLDWTFEKARYRNAHEAYVRDLHVREPKYGAQHDQVYQDDGVVDNSALELKRQALLEAENAEDEKREQFDHSAQEQYFSEQKRRHRLFDEAIARTTSQPHGFNLIHVQQSSTREPRVPYMGHINPPGISSSSEQGATEYWYWISSPQGPVGPVLYKSPDYTREDEIYRTREWLLQQYIEEETEKSHR